MPPFRNRSSVTTSNTTLSLEITLPSLLPASSLATIVGELFKNLLAQRHQIPQTFELLKREVQNLKYNRERGEENVAVPSAAEEEPNPRKRVLLRREQLKREKVEARFFSAAGSFVEQFELLAEDLHREVSSHASEIESVCFIFGATPVTPKEVYHVFFPVTLLEEDFEAQDAATPEQKLTKRATLQLFRSMVLHPELFDLMGKPLRPNNVFVALKKKLAEGAPPSSWLIPKPEYANLHRGRVTEFRLHNRPSDLTAAAAAKTKKKKSLACRNLVFANDLLQTPARNVPNEEVLLTLNDTYYTPIPMELCTPFPARSRAAFEPPSSVGEKDSLPICVEMTETPCVKRTPWTQGKASAHHSSPYCTPLFQRRNENEFYVSDPVAAANQPEDQCLEWFISSRSIKGFKDPRIFNTMFPEVHSVLKLDQKDLAGVFVNILEEREQSGSFLIHHFLSYGLKFGKTVLFLGLEQSLGHYHVAGMKLGNNLQKAKENGQIVFIEGLKMIGEAYGAKKGGASAGEEEDGDEFNFISLSVKEPLKKLFLRIRNEAKALRDRNSDKEILIIVDKLSLFGTLGVPVHDMTVFTKYLHQLTIELSASLVTLTRADPEDDCSNELLQFLLENCDLSIWTWPLKTGKSSSVSGNIKFQWLGKFETGRYQYSVEDKSVKVFALGASNAVL